MEPLGLKGRTPECRPTPRAEGEVRGKAEHVGKYGSQYYRDLSLSSARNFVQDLKHRRPKTTTHLCCWALPPTARLTTRAGGAAWGCGQRASAGRVGADGGGLGVR